MQPYWPDLNSESFNINSSFFDKLIQLSMHLFCDIVTSGRASHLFLPRIAIILSISGYHQGLEKLQPLFQGYMTCTHECTRSMVVCNLEAVENCLAMYGCETCACEGCTNTVPSENLSMCHTVDNFAPAVHTIPTDSINAFCTFQIIHTVHGRACECEHRSPQVA